MIWMSFLIWCLYSFIDGIRDSIFYHHYDHNIKKLFNEHIVFVIQRLIVSLTLCLISQNIWLLIPFVLSFSFIHNGSYYTSRHYLNKKTYNYDYLYKRKWFDQSTTSTSVFNKYMTPLVRIILFLLSIGLLIIIDMFI